MESSERPAIETLERLSTPRGELVLRRVGDKFEIISNGVFLMDTGNGDSERRLVTEAVARCAAPEPAMLIGGLGVGFSLCRAVDFPHLRSIDVVEIEAAVLAWHGRYLRAITGAALSDPRVRVHEADLLDWLRRPGSAYDIICLDIDNGPDWLVFEGNAELYRTGGLDLLRSRLRAGGVLAVWSAARDGDFEARLRDHFGDFEALETPVPRGAPDVVYVARECADRPGPPGPAMASAS